jgi:two-component system LytT family response regulator
MIRVLIIDDEAVCINLLSKQLEQSGKSISIVGSANSITEAIEKIERLSPELIFLDVELKGETGFELFAKFPNPDFQVIFTTAHSKYAVRAIKSSCLEYLLKPIDKTELLASIQKYEKLKQVSLNQQRLEILMENIHNGTDTINKIAIPNYENLVFVNVNEIIYCEADLKYTTIYTSRGEKIVSSKNLKEYEELLPPTVFFRSHKSYLINLNFVKKFFRSESYVQLLNGLQIDISHRKKDEFLKRFEKI